MKITFSRTALPRRGVVVAGVLADKKLTPSAQELDKRTRGRLRQAINASRFKGEKDQTLTVLTPAGTNLERIVLIGLGKGKDIDSLGLQNAGGSIYAAAAHVGSGSAFVAVDDIEGCKIDAAEQAAEMAFGARLRSYRFDKYRTKEKKSDKPSLSALKFSCAGPNKAKEAFEIRDKIADGVFFTRDLVSEPANILYPESFAAEAKKLTKLGVKVEVLGEAQMRKLGMGALLGVAQGSVREPKLIVMQWNGLGGSGKKKGGGNKPLAFVGKGVCFDTGGISLKPSGGMEDMKWDMGGAGVVVGLMKALAGRKAKVNVVGVAGMVENMPDGNAQRPG
ncbi:MAG: M17 family peptidase N-terminal domain-containing protein, partial [Rhodospirillales bacterium]